MRDSFRRDPRNWLLGYLSGRQKNFPLSLLSSRTSSLSSKERRKRKREAIKSRSRTTPWLLSLNNSAGVVRESFAGFVARPRAVLSMLAEKASGA